MNLRTRQHNNDCLCHDHVVRGLTEAGLGLEAVDADNGLLNGVKPKLSSKQRQQAP